jgi:hypothetical protein
MLGVAYSEEDPLLKSYHTRSGCGLRPIKSYYAQDRLGKEVVRLHLNTVVVALLSGSSLKVFGRIKMNMPKLEKATFNKLGIYLLTPIYFYERLRVCKR